MKKDDFIKLGVAEDMAEKLEAASSEELRGYIPKTRFDEVNTAKKHLEESVKERDKQLEELQKSTGDVDALKTQIAELQKVNKDAADAHAAEIKQLKINAAVESALVGAKAKNHTAVRALLKDLDKAKLDDDGTIKGLSEQIAELKKSDAYLFDTSDNKKQLRGAAPGQASDDDNINNSVDTSKMTYSQLVAYTAEHPEFKIS